MALFGNAYIDEAVMELKANDVSDCTWIILKDLGERFGDDIFYIGATLVVESLTEFAGRLDSIFRH